jgi:hypothetical protein
MTQNSGTLSASQYSTAATQDRNSTDRNDRFQRVSNHDRRIRRGDDFAGDTWRDRETGAITYVAVGQKPD